MPVCVPIKELKDTAAFARRVESASGPITVTKNGYDVFVVMQSSEYEALQDELAKTKLLLRIAQAEAERASGKHADGSAFIEELKERYGLSL